jgi:hypothetical protein
MIPHIDFQDPQLVARFRSWVGVLTAFHDFVWENLDQQFLENPQSAWAAFLRQSQSDSIPTDAH